MPGLFHGVVQESEPGHELLVAPQPHRGLLCAADGEAEQEEVAEEAAVDAVVGEAAGGGGGPGDHKLPVRVGRGMFSILFPGQLRFLWNQTSTGCHWWSDS